MDDKHVKFRVEVGFRNWLFQRFPTHDPPSAAFWYYQDDRHYVMHACLPETTTQLEKNYAVFVSECRKIEDHKFSMCIPKCVGTQGIWMFEAVSLTPTYVSGLPAVVCDCNCIRSCYDMQRRAPCESFTPSLCEF